MWGAQSSGQAATTHTLSRKIQGLVREARCYPPEREPRIVRDLYDCCRHFQGLRPKLEYCIIDSNQTIRLLALDGVIPITYRGVTYQIPVSIWCRPHYPNDAPVPYVRPTSTMVLRERHAHLDKEGRVYLPHYLSIWDPTQFTMYGVVVAMIRVFSVEPPVNSRPAVTSRAVEEPERRRLIKSLTNRMAERLHDVNEEAVTEICQLVHKREEMFMTGQHASHELRQRASIHKDAEERLKRVEELQKELEVWRLHTGEIGPREEKNVDELVQCADALDEEIIDCTAKDHAFSDALDQVDEAFVKGVIDHDMYMKEIRHISREQFFPRALRKKVEVAKARRAQVEGEGPPRRVLSASRAAPLYAS